MHSGGSMTGGSAASRTTSLLSREREIKEHEELVAGLNEKLADYAKRIEKGEGIRLTIKQRRTQAYEDLRQVQIDVSIASERVRTITEKTKTHAQQLERNEMLREQIRENLESIDSQLSGARDTQAGEERTSDEMQRMTGELSDALYERREALDALREEVLRNREQIRRFFSGEKNEEIYGKN